jgi:hypothetical protein
MKHLERGRKVMSWLNDSESVPLDSFHVQGSCHADPVLRGLEFNGFTGKDCELFWSTGGIEIPNHKD